MVALSLPPGSETWIETRLIAAYPWAVQYLLHLGASPEHALEIAQASVLAALSRKSTFDPTLAKGGDPVRAWLTGILQKRWLHDRRWHRTRFEVPLQQAPQEALSIPPHVERAEARDLLQRLREATQPARWAAWWAYEAEGQTAAEIAERERVPVSTIEWRIRRAREDFDHVLRAHGVKPSPRRRSRGGA